MDDWTAGEVRSLTIEEIGQRYRRYRLTAKENEAEMVRSLERYGQLSPIVVCRRNERAEVLDGFKRVGAAPLVGGMATLSARLMEVDERGAKAAIYGLNHVGRHLVELEEAWIIRSLVREDGLAQTEVAELLGRHKSFVCRRLALLEKLCEEASEDLGLGLLGVTMARQLLRLPAGNQVKLLAASRREQLTAAELGGVVDLLLACAGQEKEAYILANPREALRQSQGEPVAGWDPRLSPAGNRISRQLGTLLDGISRMGTWLSHRGRADLSACDRQVLAPRFVRLTSEARALAELADDFAEEIRVRRASV